MMERRHTSKFIEQLSVAIIVLSGVGAMLVLLDPIVTIMLTGGSSIKLGGTGFSDQLKGAVVAMILVGGFSGVLGYWLGASNQAAKVAEAQAAPLAEGTP